MTSNKNFDESIERIVEELNSNDLNTEQGRNKLKETLKEIASETDPLSKGDTIILYSGGESSKIVAAITAEQKETGDYQYKLLNQTQAFEVLESEEFNLAHARAFGYPTYDSMVTGIVEEARQEREKGNVNATHYTSEEMQFAYNGKSGAWALASRNFVTENPGRVVSITFSPRADGVFAATEIDAVLASSDRHESINGFNTKELTDDPQAKYKIIDRSTKATIISEIGIGEDGKVKGLTDFIDLVHNPIELDKRVELANQEQKTRLDAASKEVYSRFMPQQELVSEISTTIPTDGKNIKTQLAEPGRTYTGNITAVTVETTKQMVTPTKMIIHQTSQVPDISESDVNKKLKIEYDAKGIGNVTERDGKEVSKTLQHEMNVDKNKGDEFSR